MDYSSLKILMKERKITARNLCQKIGITESGLWKMVKNDSMQISVLEKIAYLLDVPMAYFFENNTNGSNNKNSNNSGGMNVTANGDNNQHQFSIGESEKEIIYLKEIIKLQNELIESLKKLAEKAV
jgi:transcriptional regulator with XRE-family HTH domain